MFKLFAFYTRDASIRAWVVQSRRREHQPNGLVPDLVTRELKHFSAHDASDVFGPSLVSPLNKLCEAFRQP